MSMMKEQTSKAILMQQSMMESMVLVVARWRWLDTTAQDMVAKVTTSMEEEMIMNKNNVRDES